MGWTDRFVGGLISAIQGPINNAANIFYLGPDGSSHVVQDLSASTPTNGLTLIGYRGTTADKFLDLQFPVNAYGADPTGVADSAAAIQAAVDAATAYGGAVTGVGTFRIDSPIYVDSFTRIDSEDMVIKPSPSIGNRYCFYTKRADSVAYSGARDAVFRGITLDLFGAPQSGGIGAAHASGLLFENIKFIGIQSNLHYLDIVACTNWRVVGCRFIGTTMATAVQLDGAEPGSLPGTLEPLNEDGTRCRDVEISGNYFDSIVNGAIHLHKNGHSRVIVTNNRFYWCQNCVLDDQGYPAAPGNAYLVITNNTMRGNDASSLNLQGNGVNLQSGVTDLIVADNSISAYGWPVVIQANAAVSGRVSTGSIRGNACRSNSRGCISAASAEQFSINDNKVLSVAAGYSGIVFIGREANIGNNNIVGVGTGAAAGTAAIHATMHRGSINRNIMKGTNRGVIVFSSSGANPDTIDVSSNQVVAALSNGIEISGLNGEQVRGLTVIGNHLNGESIAGNCILVIGARELAVAQNQISGLQSSSTGILLQDCGQGSVNGNVVASVTKSGQTGISVTGLGYLSVTGNTLINLLNGYSETSGAGYSSIANNISINVTNRWAIGTGSVNGTGANISV